MQNKKSLKRTLGPWLLLFFGLGNILGAGIYVLIGKVAGEAGYLAPVSFALAAVVAGLSAMSYAELSVRYPEAGGEVVYMQRAFGWSVFSIIIGVLIASAGILSSATILKGFAGYFQVLWPLPTSLIIVSAVSIIACVAVWGVKESLRVAALFTLLEIFGLLLVVVPGLNLSTITLQPITSQFEGMAPGVFAGVMAGAFLAFYAFIGFEDMVNMAEEVKQPEQNMPKAIVIALFVSTSLYFLVAVVSISYVTPAMLGQSDAPLSHVYEVITGRQPTLITLISLFAVSNGALVQIIMVSRLLFGMGREYPIFRVFNEVNSRTRTPVRATLLAAGLVLSLALWFPIKTLAEYTSSVVLLVFVGVNVAAIQLRRTQPKPLAGWRVPLPYLGIVATLYLLVVNYI